ncbi:MAG: T9SS type A sorting domain-containing protein [Saprospiraceae bacterium]
MQKPLSKCLLLLSSLLLQFIPNSDAQNLTRFEVPFIQDGQPIEHALVGGLDTPQFAEMDFNNDGLQDLLIFDRVGALPLTFLNGGTPNTVDYTFAPEYQAIFPADLDNWIVPRDYNADGAMDIFVHPTIPGIDGVMVYQGSYVNDRLQFELMEFPQNNFDILYFPLSGGGETQIYVSSVDYPAIDDIDGDGDLDIVTFNPGGGYMEYYKNTSVEQGFGRDSLIYELEESCWGGVYESGITVEVSLSSVEGECATPFTGEDDVNLRHAGSTLLTLDYNGDGLKEMILGDLSFDNLNLLINEGTTEEAWMSEQINAFPMDTPVDLTTFPAAFYLDVNNDGKKDLISAPNVRGRGDNYRNVWLYLNNGTNDNPDFEYITNRFMVDQMVDVGSDAKPVFVDVNADGLLDLLIGNQRLYSRENNQDARIFYYQNSGTLAEPVFELVTDDWMGLSDFSNTTFDFAPAFGDLDNDGDLDLLIGDDKGKLFFSDNQGGAGNEMVFNDFVYEYMGIDIGKAARPQLVDLNEDGLLDLVLGERSGNNVNGQSCGTLNYFQNVGTADSPIFMADEGGRPDIAPNSPCLGAVFTIPNGAILSYSDPVFWDFGDRIELFIGTEFGDLRHYTDLSTDPNQPYTLANEMLSPEPIGVRLSPTLADINDDGKLDMAIGNARGGITFFTTDLDAQESVNTTQVAEDAGISIYPNPAQDMINIAFDKANSTSQLIEVFNVNGQLTQRLSTNKATTQISVANWTAGLYVWRIKTKEGWAYRKVVIE